MQRVLSIDLRNHRNTFMSISSEFYVLSLSVADSAVRTPHPHTPLQFSLCWWSYLAVTLTAELLHNIAAAAASGALALISCSHDST